MEVFHVGDKVFLDDIKDYEYGRVIAIDTEDNLMEISPMINDKIDDRLVISVHIDSPHIHKIDFLPKEKVVIHDLLKNYYNKKGIINAYDITIDRYRVMINNEPHWFAPFELSLEDYVDKKDEKWITRQIELDENTTIIDFGSHTLFLMRKVKHTNDDK